MTASEQTESPLRVLAVSAFPVEAAATRFRLAQFIEPLKLRGIELTISPFLTAEQFTDLYQGGKTLSKVMGMASSVIKRLTEAAIGATLRCDTCSERSDDIWAGNI